MNTIFPGLIKFSNRDFIFGVLLIHYITVELIAPRLAIGNLCVILFFLKNQSHVSRVVRAYYKIGGAIFALWSLLFMMNQTSALYQSHSFYIEYSNCMELRDFIRDILWQVLVGVLACWNCYLFVNLRRVYIEEKAYYIY